MQPLDYMMMCYIYFLWETINGFCIGLSIAQGKQGYFRHTIYKQKYVLHSIFSLDKDIPLSI